MKKMAVFVVVWFFLGHFIIPYLLVTSKVWWLFWITYTPIDEMILFPIAGYFFLVKRW